MSLLFRACGVALLAFAPTLTTGIPGGAWVDSLSSRVTSRSFPSAFQAWTPAEAPWHPEEVTLARHDLAWNAPSYFGLAWDVTGPAAGFPGLASSFLPASVDEKDYKLRRLFAMNPSFVALAEVRYYDAPDGFLPSDSAFWQTNATGFRIPSSANGDSYLLDWHNAAFRAQVVAQATAVAAALDGVLLDVWHEEADRFTLLQAIRAAIGPNSLIVVNTNTRLLDPPTYAELNGVYIAGEQAPTQADWEALELAMVTARAHLATPKVIALETWYQTSQWDAGLIATTTASMTLADGYVLFSDPSPLPTPDHSHLWYVGIWDVNLGPPAEPALYLPTPGYAGRTFIRRFQNGYAVYNGKGSGPQAVNLGGVQLWSVVRKEWGTNHYIGDGFGDILLYYPPAEQLRCGPWPVHLEYRTYSSPTCDDASLVETIPVAMSEGQCIEGQAGHNILTRCRAGEFVWVQYDEPQCTGEATRVGRVNLEGSRMGECYDIGGGQYQKWIGDATVDPCRCQRAECGEFPVTVKFEQYSDAACTQEIEPQILELGEDVCFPNDDGATAVRCTDDGRWVFQNVPNSDCSGEPSFTGFIPWDLPQYSTGCFPSGDGKFQKLADLPKDPCRCKEMACSDWPVEIEYHYWRDAACTQPVDATVEFIHERDCLSDHGAGNVQPFCSRDGEFSVEAWGPDEPGCGLANNPLAPAPAVFRQTVEWDDRKGNGCDLAVSGLYTTHNSTLVDPCRCQSDPPVPACGAWPVNVTISHFEDRECTVPLAGSEAPETLSITPDTCLAGQSPALFDAGNSVQFRCARVVDAPQQTLTHVFLVDEFPEPACAGEPVTRSVPWKHPTPGQCYRVGATYQKFTTLTDPCRCHEDDGVHVRSDNGVVKIGSSDPNALWFRGDDGAMETPNQLRAGGVDVLAELKRVQQQVGDMQAVSDYLRQTVETSNLQVDRLARTLLLTQTELEQNTRSAGGSGIVRVRGGRTGSRPYDSPAQADYGMLNLHSHANNARTVGLAELNAVLNGVNFYTRHNDYALKMPSKTSGQYGALEDVPFPDVPPSIQPWMTVEAQTAEMAEYFRAWITQNVTHRDYRPYFRPVITYLEGTWITESDFADGAESDRHQTLANSWEQLYDGIRFILQHGAKDPFENVPWVPSAVRSFKREADGKRTPQWANWEYRVSVAPLPAHVDLPTSSFRLEDSLVATSGGRQTPENVENLRNARFELNRDLRCLQVNSPYGECSWENHDSFSLWESIDEIMSYVPGKNNYGSVLRDDTLGQSARKVLNQEEELNTAFYSRRYVRHGTDAAGRSFVHRGFNDENMFAAMTTQERVNGLELDQCARYANTLEVLEQDCTPDSSRPGHFLPQYIEQKWSYAIPLEVVYLTPLHKWNPHQVTDYGEETRYQSQVFDGCGNTLCDGSAEKPFGGVDRVRYFQTPAELFSNKDAFDPADTTRGVVYVRDPVDAAKNHSMRASGVWVHLPKIVGLEEFGDIRIRYPIAPIHEHSSTAWKEMKAMQDIVFQEDWTEIVRARATGNGGAVLQLTFASEHDHLIVLSPNQVNQALVGNVTLTSTQAAAHVHDVTFWAEQQPDQSLRWFATSIDPNFENHSLRSTSVQ